jgi:hypothetical protein
MSRRLVAGSAFVIAAIAARSAAAREGGDVFLGVAAGGHRAI